MDEGLLDLIKQSSCNGFFLKDCMPELQTLMTQLDKVIVDKQAVWQKELQSARDELTACTSQLKLTRELLKQKENEVRGLESKMENKSKVVNQYDAELRNLKNQVRSLRENQAQLSERRVQKQKKINSREKEYQEEVDELKLELSKKQLLLATHHKESSEWEISKKSLKKQIECMEHQKEAILANYDKCRHNLQEARNELKHTKDVKDQIDLNSRGMIKKLEEELLNSKTMIEKQELLNKSLQARIQQERERSDEDRRRVREEGEVAFSKVAVLDEENKRLSEFLRMKEDALETCEARVAALQRQFNDANAKLNDKQAETQERTRYANERVRYERKIGELEEQLCTMRTSEASMRDQLQLLERQLDKSNECSHRYLAQAASISSQHQQCGNGKMETLTEELKTLQTKLENMENSHAAQLEGVKCEVNKLMKVYARNSKAVAAVGGADGGSGGDAAEALSKTCADMERRLGEEAKRRQRLNNELQHVARNLQSIQHNGVGNSTLFDVDGSLHEVEQSFLELKRGYEKADSNLKKKNLRLKDKVTTLKNLGLKLDHSNTRVSTMSCAEDREAAAIMTGSDYGGDHLDHNQSTTTSQSDVFDDDEDMTTRHLRTPTPTREFLRSIGFYSSPETTTSTTAADRSAKRQDVGGSASLLKVSGRGRVPTDVKSLLMSSYVDDDMERTNEMQRRIESHIDEVQQAMTNVMEKYFAPSHDSKST